MVSTFVVQHEPLKQQQKLHPFNELFHHEIPSKVIHSMRRVLSSNFSSDMTFELIVIVFMLAKGKIDFSMLEA